MAPKPSGVVTFLFTDIEGSTRRWESDADSMRQALTVHDEIMREPLGRMTVGCSSTPVMKVCAAFESPRSAVDAAIDCSARAGVAGADGGSNRRGGRNCAARITSGPALDQLRVMSASQQCKAARSSADGLTAQLLTEVSIWLAMGSRRLRDIVTTGRGVPGESRRLVMRDFHR